MDAAAYRWPLTVVAVFAIAVPLVGCKHLGPRSIVADRVPYNEAVAVSWKEQTLLNIVKVRYADTPFFVDVAQIVSGYQMQHSAKAEGNLSAASAVLMPPVADRLGAKLGLESSYMDRPTVSYSPQTGAQFIRNLTSPIPPSAVLFLIQSGYPADVVLELGVDAINGIKNSSINAGEAEPGDPEFRKMTQILRKAQIAGNLSMRVEYGKDKSEAVVIFIRSRDIEPGLAAEIKELKKLLKLDPEVQEFRVVFGSASRAPNEIAILTRSIYRTMIVLSGYVEVPLGHQQEGRAHSYTSLANAASLMHIRSGPKRPADCFAAVHYRGCWFWVDDTDLNSKRTFGYLNILLALADSGNKEGLPLVTIQAN